MKHIKTLLTTALSLIFILVFADGAIGGNIGTSFLDKVKISGNSEPYVWSCGNRLVLDDNVEPGRISDGREELIERWGNYLFEGEQLKWDILVLDMGGINNIDKVYATVGEIEGRGNEIEANCRPYIEPLDDLDSCDARIGEYKIMEFDSEIMKYYSCVLTIEPSESMYGEKWITIEARDVDGLIGVLNENEFWYLNPTIALSVNHDGELFEDLEPGKVSYSKNISIKNAADEGSGVMMDIFISGEDFISSDDSAFCPEENKLSFDRFRFFAQNEQYNTNGLPDADNEGYRPIKYGIGFNDPAPFYNAYEVIPKEPAGPYYLANILYSGEELDLKLKLDLPEFCKGEFDGGMYFWAEAI